MVEYSDTDPDLSADPAGRKDIGPLASEDERAGTLIEGMEENARIGRGTVLNRRFQIIKCIGAGGMSAVYKAVDWRMLVLDETDPYVAVKVLNPRFQADPQRVEALERQVELCQQLVHPNIVRVYAFRRHDSTVYMVMEYLRGEPLTARIRSQSFSGMSAREALPIIEAMGQALAYAHSRGIVHRDFKPANVFLTKTGKIKLIDFGIARAFAERQGKQETALVEAISPAYASPEMLQGQDPHPRDDVYSLACTAYELLTGAHPFGYGSATEAREAGLTVERHQALSYKQWQALCHALAFEAAERTSSVEGFLKEFNEVLWRVQPLYVAAGAAVCLLVALGGAFGLLSNRPGEESPGAGAMIESTPQPDLATGWVAETASVERKPPAMPLNHGDVATPLVKQTSGIKKVPSEEIKPKAKVTASEGTALRVSALLARAERQMKTKKLTMPVGDAALESYQQVLKLIPGHEAALQGIARIKGEYKLWAEVDRRRGDWNRAEASLEKALAIDPEDPLSLVALRELREAQKRAQKQRSRELREQEPHYPDRAETMRPRGKLRTQVNVRALTTANQAGGEIIVTEQECSGDQQGNFAVSTAINQAIRHTGCAVRFDQDRLAIHWNNGTVSAHSITEFASSEALFGWHSSPR